MFWQMITIEQTKLTRRTMFWVELALVISLILIMFGTLFSVQRSLTSGAISDSSHIRVEGVDDPHEMDILLTWPGGIINTFSAISGLGAILLIILAGAMTAQEYTWRSFSLWLSRGVPRAVVLLAKFVIIVGMAVLITVTAVFIGTLITAGLSRYYLGQVPFAAVNWSAWVTNIFITTYAMLPYAALAMLLAILSRSTVVAIGVGLSFAAVVESLLAQILPLLGGTWNTIAQYLPANLAVTLGNLRQTVATGTTVSQVTNGMTPGTAAIVVALYLFVLIGSALVAFQKQDLGG